MTERACEDLEMLWRAEQDRADRHRRSLDASERHNRDLEEELDDANLRLKGLEK